MRLRARSRGPLGSLARSSARWLLGAFALAASGCDFPAPAACTLECGAAGECPSGFACQAETRLCAPPGMREPCALAVAAPGGVSGLVDAGELPPGQDAMPEPSLDAGDEPDPHEPQQLVIEPTSIGSLCSGAELTLELSAVGGVGPYSWRVLESPPGVQLSIETGARVQLGGVPESAGVVLVELEDATGRRVPSGPLPVYERPVIATSRLPAACAGAGYGAELEAWAPDVEALVWSARALSDDALSLDELGLAVAGSSLSGAPAVDDDTPASVRLELALHDAHCAAEPAELELELARASSDACPSIAVVGASDPDTLPPPCRGNLYTEALTAEGGQPPFTWSELASPPGLYFDVDSGAVEGIAEGDGVLAVRLTDGGGRSIEKRYELFARDKCWIAYVAGGVAPARLTLVDPRLLARQPEAARRVLEPEGVLDFRFSPDGRFIAYRLGSAPDARIELLRVSDGASRPLELAASVADYAWSSDSRLLFLASDAPQRQLSAVDVSPSEATGELAAIRMLEARSVPIAGGPLSSYGARQLAYLSPESAAPLRLRLVTVGLERAAVGAPVIRSELEFAPSARLVGAPAGAVVADPEAGLVSFFARDGAPAVARPDVVLSSSGALAARASAGSLAIFDSASDGSAPPLFEIPGCMRLLAWSSERDRLSCFAERPARSPLAFFELGASGLLELPEPSEPAALELLDPAGSRRVFSPSGRWFAIGAAGGLSVWSLEEGRPRLAAQVPSAELGSLASTLAFSPDERWLLVGAGNRLWLLEPGSPDGRLVELSPSALLDEPCGERSVDGVEQWCGSDSGLSSVRWSSGSDVVAFRSTLGTLSLLDVSEAGEGRIGEPMTPDVDCDEACLSATTARFQP